MARRERNVPNAITADGPFLAAILDTLDDLYDLLDARLPHQAGVEEPDPNTTGGGVMRLQEPAEPSPQPLTEPARPATTPPARQGRGSSTPAWETFAQQAGVTVPDGASRADIIRACVKAGVIPAEES